MKINFKKGAGLVEIIVAVFVFSIVLGSLITASNMYLSGASDNLKSTQGAYIAQEGIEALKIMRDYSWDTITALSTSTNYYLTWNTSSSTWVATVTPTTPDSVFNRTFNIYPIYRDNLTGDSTTSPAVGFTFDPNTKKVDVTVSWRSKNATTTKILSTYIADIL
jgi:type II secretory pathway pseudopilin PulG